MILFNVSFFLKKPIKLIFNFFMCEIKNFPKIVLINIILSHQGE
jgi:hypothetical protein